ncbi:hypothetical protein H6G80_13200 [Nostoc sp. FACHB-87]|nr:MULTISPECIES: hypothetical protein [Nostocales]MBD2300327.1 hypothetical protein [Nostoc sp. FACHB-190]MBD2455039.1 hypothetical protein [Nostoc sp. FACHB-87]MBD2474640.1 hypothetical protein [Anabaena sp. FACHB-83]MBD2487984.1 hypothetical protein [Aulosira sp. FACHB-615]
MSFTDGLLLTLVNTVACLMLPKLLSVILTDKTEAEAKVATQPVSSSEIS